jgi:hypothetical protein
MKITILIAVVLLISSLVFADEQKQPRSNPTVSDSNIKKSDHSSNNQGGSAGLKRVSVDPHKIPKKTLRQTDKGKTQENMKTSPHSYQ